MRRKASGLSARISLRVRKHALGAVLEAR
jgi:hypothetical protein